MKSASGIYIIDKIHDGLGIQNVFVNATGDTMTGPLYLPDGTASLPSLGFASDTDTGLYRIGDNNLGISTAGSLKFDVSATGINSALPFTITSDNTQALLVQHTDGTDVFSVDTSQADAVSPDFEITFHVPDGSNANPAESVINLNNSKTMLLRGFDRTTDGNNIITLDAGTGQFDVISNGSVIANNQTFQVLNASGGSTAGFRVTESPSNTLFTVDTVNEQIRLPEGTAAAPSLLFDVNGTADADTGIYKVGANDIGISAGGTLRFNVSQTEVSSIEPIILQNSINLNSGSKISFNTPTNNPGIIIEADTNDNGTADQRFDIYTSDTNGDFVIRDNTGSRTLIEYDISAGDLILDGTSDVILQTANTTRMTVSTTDISTTIPAYLTSYTSTTQAGADAGITLTNGFQMYIITVGTATAGFNITLPAGTAGRVIYVINKSTFTIASNSVNSDQLLDGEVRFFAHDGTSWYGN